MAIDPDVARIILEAHMEGDICPEAEEIIFKQKVTEDEEKALKTILNTEQVAAFVPPGGSDITEHHES